MKVVPEFGIHIQEKNINRMGVKSWFIVNSSIGHLTSLSMRPPQATLAPSHYKSVMRMFKLKIIFIILLLPFLVMAAEDPLIGTWNIEVKPDSDEQFPFWKEIKYPKKLVISKSGQQYTMEFTDQYNYKCEAKPMSTNRDLELVFTFCSGLGTKSPLSWSPIHHAKIINGKLHGIVTSNRYLFKWVGERGQ